MITTSLGSSNLKVSALVKKTTPSLNIVAFSKDTLLQSLDSEKNTSHLPQTLTSNLHPYGCNLSMLRSQESGIMSMDDIIAFRRISLLRCLDKTHLGEMKQKPDITFEIFNVQRPLSLYLLLDAEC